MDNSLVKLEGEFSFEVYDANNNLVKSKKNVRNFITNSGVLYPYYFAFADCFRYLSLGYSSYSNSTGTQSYPETTGLTTNSEFMYLGKDNYTGGCGNQGFLSSNTVSLVRQWAIPDTQGTLFTSSHNFKELMVTPGRPCVTGWVYSNYIRDNNGNISNYIYKPGKACIAGTTFLSDDPDDTTYYPLFSISGGDPGSETYRIDGEETSQSAGYYEILNKLGENAYEQGPIKINRTRPSICDAIYAFARVAFNNDSIYVLANQRLEVAYKLKLTFNTGIQSSPELIDSNATADPNLSKIAFVSKITNPGIKLINDGVVVKVYGPVSERLQHSNYLDAQKADYNWGNNYGESFIPSLGIPLEPSAIYEQNGNFLSYITDDNIQFFANPSGGKIDNPIPGTLPQNSGLAGFKNSVEGSTVLFAAGTINQNSFWNDNFYNIRVISNSSVKSNVGFPDSNDISQNDENYFPKFIQYQERGIPTLAYEGRSGSIRVGHAFIGLTNMSMKSFVIGYRDADFSTIPNNYSSVIPDRDNSMTFYDCLFSGISGTTAFLPTQNIIDDKTGIMVSTDYNYLSIDNGSKYPIFTTSLSWVAECPQGVQGC